MCYLFSGRVISKGTGSNQLPHTLLVYSSNFLKTFPRYSFFLLNLQNGYLWFDFHQLILLYNQIKIEKYYKQVYIFDKRKKWCANQNKKYIFSAILSLATQYNLKKIHYNMYFYYIQNIRKCPKTSKLSRNNKEK